METSSQGSRRSAGRRPSPRPDSSASVSSHATRMTPASSNSTTTGGSTLNLPQQMGVGSRKVSSSGGASLLQERLRERKVEKDREKRRGSVDGAFGNGYEDGEGGRRGSLREGARDSSSLSSPVKSSVSGGMGERRPSSSGPKGMGVKQIEEVSFLSYLSRTVASNKEEGKWRTGMHANAIEFIARLYFNQAELQSKT